MDSDRDVYGRYIDDFRGYVITLDYEGFFAALSAGHIVAVAFKHFGYYKGQVLVIINNKNLFLHI